jgi:hypothetical protein
MRPRYCVITALKRWCELAQHNNLLSTVYARPRPSDPANDIEFRALLCLVSAHHHHRIQHPLGAPHAIEFRCGQIELSGSVLNGFLLYAFGIIGLRRACWVILRVILRDSQP